MANLKRNLFRAYVALAVLTLVFQIFVRSGQCVGSSGCVVSYAKAVAWSIVWPVNWVLYITGLP